MAFSPLRLILDGEALVRNFHWFQTRAGVPATPAIKADGYGLGAAEVMKRLREAGARAFAVSTWAEVAALADPEAELIVLHGFQPADAATVGAFPLARPVLNSPAQLQAWRSTFPGRVADLMVDTGMNRLGLEPAELAVADGMAIDTIHSHFACADEPDHPMTGRQIERFAGLAASGRRRMIANSAGACLGAQAAFDGIRPGLGLYGGIPHPDAKVEPVVRPQALVLQVRDVPAGQSVGYGATWRASARSRIAIINLGYADGIPRGLGTALSFIVGERRCPAVGRVSMDLIAVDVTGADVAEGDWLTLDLDLPLLAKVGLFSQYELLTALSRRYERLWT